MVYNKDEEVYLPLGFLVAFAEGFIDGFGVGFTGFLAAVFWTFGFIVPFAEGFIDGFGVGFTTGFLAAVFCTFGFIVPLGAGDALALALAVAFGAGLDLAWTLPSPIRSSRTLPRASMRELYSLYTPPPIMGWYTLANARRGRKVRSPREAPLSGLARDLRFGFALADERREMTRR